MWVTIAVYRTDGEKQHNNIDAKSKHLLLINAVENGATLMHSLSNYMDGSLYGSFSAMHCNIDAS